MVLSRVRVFGVFCGCTGASNSTCTGSTGATTKFVVSLGQPAYSFSSTPDKPLIRLFRIAAPLDNCTGALVLLASVYPVLAKTFCSPSGQLHRRLNWNLSDHPVCDVG